MFAAMDIGSSQIRTVIAKVNEKTGMVNILGVGSSPSTGIRRGRVTDIEEAVNNITASLDEAERMSGEHVHRAWVGVGGPLVRSDDAQGVVAISGQNAEITEEDVDRVLDAARSVNMPSNREILRIVPNAFSVDSQKNVKYPVGMSGIRLEVEAHIISGETGAIKNLEKTLYQTGVDISDIVPSFLAAGESVLTRRQKELGCVLVEIGACSTNLAVFEDGSVVYSSVIPVGGEHVTNDMAIGMRAAVDTAEKVKLQYGHCNPNLVTDREEVDLGALSNTDVHNVNLKLVAKMIEARYHEIFLMVRDELSRIGRDGMLPAGAILCGGAVRMPGVLDLARESLNLPVQIGQPTTIEGITDRAADPAFAHVIGLLQFGARYGESPSFFDFDLGRILRSVTDFFRSLLP